MREGGISNKIVTPHSINQQVSYHTVYSSNKQETELKTSERIRSQLSLQYFISQNQEGRSDAFGILQIV